MFIESNERHLSFFVDNAKMKKIDAKLFLTEEIVATSLIMSIEAISKIEVKHLQNCTIGAGVITVLAVIYCISK